MQDVTKDRVEITEDILDFAKEFSRERNWPGVSKAKVKAIVIDSLTARKKELIARLDYTSLVQIEEYRDRIENLEEELLNQALLSSHHASTGKLLEEAYDLLDEFIDLTRPEISRNLPDPYGKASITARHLALDLAAKINRNNQSGTSARGVMGPGKAGAITQRLRSL
jgi:flagellar biosynthesis/type III secretory pathway chaperone